MMRPFESFSTATAAILICMAIAHVVSEENWEIDNATGHVGTLKGHDDLTKRAAELLVHALEKEMKLGGGKRIHAASLLKTLRAGLEKKQLKNAAPEATGAASLDVSAFRQRKFAQDDPPPEEAEGGGDDAGGRAEDRNKETEPDPVNGTNATHEDNETTLGPYADYSESGAWRPVELASGALLAGVLVLAARQGP